MSNKAISAGRLPDKRSINLAVIGKNNINLVIAVPAIIAIVLVAFVFGKFAVADRLLAATRAEQEVNAIQAQIDEGYDKISGYGDITEIYSHYTYSGMTEEELNRADRVKVMDMLSRVVLPRATISTWTVTSNTLVLTMTGSTLQEINQISQDLMAEPNVDYCTVNTATTGPQSSISDIVDAKITVYLVKVSDEEVSEDASAQS